METKFTKGEWKINNRGRYLEVMADETEFICDLGESDTCFDEEEANARLISAAPDMYFALENILSELEYCSLPSSMNFYIHNARVALNKAVCL